MRRGVILAICLAGLALGIVVAMGEKAPRTAGANRVSSTGFSIDVPPRRELCQPYELVPADSASIRVFIAALPVPTEPPPLEVRLVTGESSAIARGRVSGDYRTGPVTVALAPEVRRPTGAEVCIANGGDTLVGFGSGSTPEAQAAVMDGGVVQAGRIRIEYVRPGTESWWSLVPTIAHRFGLGKGDVLGSWSLWAAALVLLLAIGVSGRLVAGRDAA